MERPVRSAYMDIVDQRKLDEGSYRVTIAANEQVRQPPELDFEGLSTANYERNPVVMWSHDAVGRSPSGGLPIGRTSRSWSSRPTDASWPISSSSQKTPFRSGSRTHGTRVSYGQLP